MFYNDLVFFSNLFVLTFNTKCNPSICNIFIEKGQIIGYFYTPDEINTELLIKI